MAGGPPCQGFSTAGRRTSSDKRNELFRKYVEFAEIVEPAIVLVENVNGMNMAFSENKQENTYAVKLKNALSHNYHVFQDTVYSSKFGVPQFRPRLLTVGYHKNKFDISFDFFDLLEELRINFLISKKLPLSSPVTVEDAIGDISNCHNTIVCNDPDSPPNMFREIRYREENVISPYQRLMRKGCTSSYQPNSLRLVNHTPKTVQKFKLMRKFCRKGVSLSKAERQKIETELDLNLKKHHIVFLDKNKPAHTITSLPDDLIHYSQPRVHTVREYARFQSFPDWFEFKGKFTTGGKKRKSEVPRYTQVGNAVPPLLAEAIGLTLLQIMNTYRIC